MSDAQSVDVAPVVEEPVAVAPVADSSPVVADSPSTSDQPPQLEPVDVATGNDDNDDDDDDSKQVPIIDDDDINIVNMKDLQDEEREALDQDAAVDDGRNPNDVYITDDSVQGFFGHQDAIFCIAMSPKDDSIVITGDGNETVCIWNRTTGEELYKLKDEHKDSIIAVDYNFDGSLFATGSMDSTVRVYNAEDAKLKQALEGPAEDIEWMSWHPKGNVLVAGSRDTTTWMWNAANGTCMQVFGGHLGPVLCGTFTADGKRLLTASEDGTSFVYNPKTGKPQHHFKGDMYHEGPITCIEAHPDKKLSVFMSGSMDGTVALCNYTTGKILSKIEAHEGGVEAVAFCNSNPWAASGGIDGKISVWDVNTGASRTSFAHEDVVTTLQWHVREPLVYSCSADHTVRVWDARTGQQVRKFQGHQDTVLSFVVTPDGKHVISCSDDQVALVFALV
jgi:WD40 repeat protein